ncbi:low molecular weight phosphatase family protein [Sanguibacter sp. Z1732]|uniref:arsenate-mycothiol transferase ArsC n=1 Tax=Sanguibacter sp. Z1732 TaxID=3435412 RepID=UPI003D9CAA40
MHPKLRSLPPRRRTVARREPGSGDLGRYPPADRISRGAIEVARRHGLDLPLVRPRHLSDVLAEGDLLISVCDRAHEELALPIDIHWSVPDPVTRGDDGAFDEALDELTRRVQTLAPRLSPMP